MQCEYSNQISVKSNLQPVLKRVLWVEVQRKLS